MIEQACNKTIHCFGDSHIEVFKYIDTNQLLKNVRLNTLVVGGATAQGMVNLDSKTKTLEIFKYAIKKVDSNDYLLFMLGEVDCGFVIWYRAEKYKISIDEQLQISLNNYFNFINETIKLGYKKIIVCTCHLPTIKDNRPDFGEVANLRKEVKASQMERTKLTFRFNQSIRDFCKEKGLYLLDIENDILDRKTNLVKNEYLNISPHDHHLNNSKVAPLYVQRLNELI